MAMADPLAASLHAADIQLWTVRHGETETNRALLLAGSGTNAPLTDARNAAGTSGILQASIAAQRLYLTMGGDDWARGVMDGSAPPLLILSSPLLRAQQTAAAFTGLLDERRESLGKGTPLHEFRVSRGLREIAYGSLESLPLESAKKMPFWGSWATAPDGSGRDFLGRFPGGESRFDVLLRQRDVLRRLLRWYPGRRIVTFAHYETVIAQRAIFGLLGVDPGDGALRAEPIKNAEPFLLLGLGTVQKTPGN